MGSRHLISDLTNLLVVITMNFKIINWFNNLVLALD